MGQLIVIMIVGYIIFLLKCWWGLSSFVSIPRIFLLVLSYFNYYYYYYYYYYFLLTKSINIANIELKLLMDREIEKLKLSELSCRQGVIEVAKMWVAFFYCYNIAFYVLWHWSCLYFTVFHFCLIYKKCLNWGAIIYAFFFFW